MPATATKINTMALRDAVALIAPIAKVNAIKPIFQCIRFRGSSIAATCGDQSMAYHLPQMDFGDGGCVPASTVLGILKESHAEKTAISFEGNQAIIDSDGLFKINTIDASEFPIVGSDIETPHESDAMTIGNMLSRVAFAMAGENTRYAMNGVLLECGNGKVQAVATDGRMLAKCGIVSTSDHQAVLPQAAVKTLQRLLNDESLCRYGFDDSAAKFVSGPVEYSTSLLDGKFPPYKDVIPKDAKIISRVEANDLLHAIKLAKIAASIESPSVAWTVDKGEIRVVGQSAEYGESNARAQAETKGDSLTVGMSPDMSIKLLSVIDGVIQIGLNAANQPVTFRSSEHDWLAVQMPTRLPE